MKHKKLNSDLKSRVRWLTTSGAIGLLVGYAIVAPLGMVFFHASHQGLTVAQLERMQRSVVHSALSSFGLSMWAWALCFAILGMAGGAIVGAVMFELERRRRSEHAHSLALADANAKLTAAYEQLLRADRLASLGILASTVVHDINNYLTLIIATAEDELDGESSQARMVEAGEESPWTSVLLAGTNIRSLCRSVKGFGAARTPASGGADVVACIDEALLLTARILKQGEVHMVRDFPSIRPQARVNPSELKQVVVNLIQNACDAMEGGGRLTIAVVDHDGGIGIRVSDTGVGIPANVAPHVFEAFYTTKAEGRGTGISP